jgi:hypothetical protein
MESQMDCPGFGFYLFAHASLDSRFICFSIWELGLMSFGGLYVFFSSVFCALLEQLSLDLIEGWLKSHPEVSSWEGIGDTPLSLRGISGYQDLHGMPILRSVCLLLYSLYLLIILCKQFLYFSSVELKSLLSFSILTFKYNKGR